MPVNINGSTGISGVDGSAGTPAIQGSDTNTGVFFGTNTIDFSTDGTSRLSIGTDGDLNVDSGTLFVDASTNRVGIGTTSVSAKLHSSSGSSSVTPNASADELFLESSGNVGLQFGCPNTGNARISFGDPEDNEAGRIFYDHSTNAMQFDIAGSERARIDSAGRLLVGTSTSGSERFRAENDGGGEEVAAFRQTHGSTPRGIIISYTGAAPNNTGLPFLYCNDTSTLRLEIRSNGGIANYQSNNANLCDEREKKNIETLDSTWGCLKNWELKKFHYNEDADTDDKRYGVIAQQVAPHCPEVITDWVKQKAEDAVLDDDGNVVTPAVEEVTRMGVKEQQMMWMAIKALQEAQTRIETLETRLTALEGGTN